MMHIRGASRKAPWADIQKGYQFLSSSMKKNNKDAALLYSFLCMEYGQMFPVFRNKEEEAKKILIELSKEGNSNAMMDLALWEWSQNNDKEAMHLLNKILEKNPANPYACLALARLCYFNPSLIKSRYDKLFNHGVTAAKTESVRTEAELLQAVNSITKEIY